MRSGNEPLVRDWMTPEVHVIAPDVAMPVAYKQMKQFQVRHLPVLDSGKLVGMLSLGDARASSPWEDNPEAMRMRAEMFMSTQLVTVDPERKLKDAARIMLEKHIGCLPVMEDGKLVGILSETDVLRAFLGS